jgi:hypothetical protein
MANLPVSSDPQGSQVFFNGYFSQPIQTSPAIYGQVYGYFYTLTNSADTASALSQAIITLTYNNKLDPLAVIKEFQAAPNSSNVKQLLISFFNSAKGATSKLGYNKNNTTPVFIARNIVA